MSTSNYKRLIWLIKWTPHTLLALMVLHCVLLLSGVNSTLLAHIGVSPLLYIVMLVLSYKMDFCEFHRLALHYDLAVWCFCWLRSTGWINDILTPMRIVMLCVGVVIITITATVMRYEKRCGRDT